LPVKAVLLPLPCLMLREATVGKRLLHRGDDDADHLPPQQQRPTPAAKRPRLLATMEPPAARRNVVNRFMLLPLTSPGMPRA